MVTATSRPGSQNHLNLPALVGVANNTGSQKDLGGKASVLSSRSPSIASVTSAKNDVSIVKPETETLQSDSQVAASAIANDQEVQKSITNLVAEEEAVQADEVDPTYTKEENAAEDEAHTGNGAQINAQAEENTKEKSKKKSKKHRSRKDRETGAGNGDETTGKRRDKDSKKKKDLVLTAEQNALAPPSYMANSEKETMILRYVENFKRQYSQLYANRKELLLCPRNEFGIEKFICTTIRPTKLPYKEFYDYRGCARFVADYLSYEHLDPPHELPVILTSPTHTLARQSGNCFDYAILLVSLLRGVGYDAYVVSGYAARHVTLMDETRISFNRPSLANFSNDSGVFNAVATAITSGVGTAALGSWLEGEILTQPIASTINEVSPQNIVNPPQTNNIPAPSISGTRAPTADQGNRANSAAGMAGSPDTGNNNGPTPSGTTGSGGSHSGPKYKIKPPRNLWSQFLKKQEEKYKEAEEKIQASKKAEEDAKKAAQEEDPDDLKGLRVHAWVLVLPGKREVADKFFIEPTTGKVYSIDNSEHYLGVESIFSNHNYWVNMQICYEGLKHISFDLSDLSKWEFIFPDVSPKLKIGDKRGGADGIAGGGGGDTGGGMWEDDEDEEQVDSGQQAIDLPPSWVNRLELTKEQIESRCPSGKKTVTYRDFKLETYAEYHREDGMVSRITIYSDKRRVEKREIRELFENRKDKLKQRIHFPAQHMMQEFFEEGRQHGLQSHVLVNGRTTEMTFYPNARSDGLIRRLEESNKIMTYFTDRDDRLEYRSVTFAPVTEEDDMYLEPDDEERGVIVKMTERFGRDPNVNADEDVSKRTFFIKEEKIRVVYHLGSNRIVAANREFKKGGNEFKTGLSDFNTNLEVTESFCKPQKRQHLYAKLASLMRAEQSCRNAVKNAQREAEAILRQRRHEEGSIELIISVYDTIRNDALVQGEDNKDLNKEEETSTQAALDFLSPFLVNLPNPTKLTKEEAQAVKDACLRDFKERLVRKADIIQSRIDAETGEMQRRQVAYQKNQDTLSKEDEEEYVAYCNEAMFRIHILEQRLARHKELAPEKFIMLDKKLRADPRLYAL